ncbi:MAG: DNA starvation/stationary phase protection protein Dps [Anaerolineaceae bacterium]|nr:DNA starvation/stationary phase protection protein Dps [Anaerolineaceae bacterium]
MISTMHETRNDINHRIRTSMVELLNQQLADAFDLYSQTKQSHWNVKGMHFMQLHLLFDELAEGLTVQIDDIAERATALGGTAQGTARMAAEHSRLPAYPEHITSGVEVVAVLAERYAQYGATTRAAIDNALEHEDQSTADLFIEISRKVDKALWFLEAHLQ